MNASIKTPEEIQELKNHWEEEHWVGLEEEAGFEAHREELLAFRLETEAQWKRDREKRLLEKAEKLGCPGNLALAQYVLVLEYRLDEIERRLARLGPSVDGN